MHNNIGCIVNYILSQKNKVYFDERKLLNLIEYAHASNTALAAIVTTMEPNALGGYCFLFTHIREGRQVLGARVKDNSRKLSSNVHLYTVKGTTNV